MSYSKGLGATMGEGMGMFVQQFLGRQDQLKALAAQEEQLRQQQVQRELENQRAVQQAELQRQQLELQNQQFITGREDVLYNRTRTEGSDAQLSTKEAKQERNDQLRTFFGPQMNDFMTRRDADVAQYAPTTKDGRPNPQYNQALWMAAQTQQKEANKLWQQLSMSVGTGESWEGKTNKLISFIGGESLPSAAPAPVAAPVMATPQMVAPAPVVPALPQPGDRNMERGNAALGDAPAPVVAPTVAPPVSVSDSAALPPRIQDVPPSQLVSMDDATLTATYGQGGMVYANAARAEYVAQQKAQRESVRSALAGNWTEQFKELSKDPNLTPVQRNAMAIISGLNALPLLNAEQQAAFREAANTLQPAMYTAASWNKLLETKDPAVILGALPLYQQHAPNVVAGYDPSYFADLQGTELAKRDAETVAALAAASASDASAVERLAGARKTGVEATRIELMTPGDLAKQGAEYGEIIASTDGKIAGTALTTAQTTGEYLDQDLARNEDAREGKAAQLDAKTAQLKARQDAYELGIKNVGQWAKTGATAYQLIQTNPDAWAQMKRDLGVTDSGLTALLQQGRYEYGRKLSDEDVATKLKLSQIATDGARRAGIIATTAGTRADTLTENATRPLKVEEMQARITQIDASVLQINQGIAESKLRGQDITSRVAERDALLNERSTLLTAQANAATGNALNSTANALAVPGRLANDTTRAANDTTRVGLERERVIAARDSNNIARTRANAYISSVKGNPQLDAAKLADLKAKTLLTRSKDPNDVLYSPALVNAKAGDPLDKLKKSVGVYYTQADQALKQATSYQTQIDSLLDKGKTISGGFDIEKLTPADQAKLTSLTTSRDKAMQVVANRTATADQMLLKGMESSAVRGTTLMAPGAGLSGLQPDFAKPLETMTAAYSKRYPGGLIPFIHEGHRTPERQTTLYQQGRNGNPGKVVTNANAGQSLHNYGYATDVYWKDPKTGKTLGPNDPRAQAAWKQLGAMAPQFGLRWGGTFPGLVDMPHFEPANYSWEQAQKGKAPTWGGQAAQRLTTGTAAPLIKSATTSAQLADIEARLVASGMPRDKVVAFIRTTKATATLPRPDTRIAGAGPPQGVTPVGQAQGIANRITRAAWIQAQDIPNKAMAELWLDRTVNGLMPKGTAQQKATLRTDLATTLGW
ncbi:M15 family metallopeptidase [Deinococcus sp. QL22]|uniref:M15 family metallopeptidase n=1 Tax=Deinococcus sp. QL22 TaxID=2939437 RepID=UPI002016D2F4|nr:M15 family metallopeptidase [Deinococcus sp. QL22]UQN10827.1 M15 family metallopeptidase [Deinococcus sp. QL22]